MKRAKSLLITAMKEESVDAVSDTAVDLFKDLPSEKLYQISRNLNVQHSRKFITVEIDPQHPERGPTPKRRDLLWKTGKEMVGDIIPKNLKHFFDSHVNVAIGSGEEILPYVVIFEFFIDPDDSTLWITLCHKFGEPHITVSLEGNSEDCDILCEKRLTEILKRQGQSYRQESLGNPGSGEFLEDIDISQKAALFDYYFVHFGIWIATKSERLFEIGQLLYNDFIDEPVIV